jgi:hypothetical protein
LFSTTPLLSCWVMFCAQQQRSFSWWVASWRIEWEWCHHQGIIILLQ